MIRLAYVFVFALFAGCSHQDATVQSSESPSGRGDRKVDDAGNHAVTRVGDLPPLPPPTKNSNGVLTNEVLGAGHVIAVNLLAKKACYATTLSDVFSLRLESVPSGLRELVRVQEIWSYHMNRELKAGDEEQVEVRVSSVVDIARSRDGLYRCRWKYSDRTVNNMYAGKPNVPQSTMGELNSNDFFIRVHQGTALAYARVEDIPPLESEPK